jgi:hypothetical protein
MAEGEAAAIPAEEAMLTLDMLPYECLVECLSHLSSAAELCAVSIVSTALREAAAADFLWRGLCVKNQHGQALDFRQVSCRCRRTTSARR